MRIPAFLCFVVFLTLRLTGAVDWSWGYVCLPAAWFAGALKREVEIEKATGLDLTNV